MLGIALLIFAILLYPSKYKRWSILLFIIFSMQGLRLIPDEVIGMKCLDIAFIYMVTINLYSMIYEKEPDCYLPYVHYFVWSLLAFWGCSAIFSLIHYDFTFFQVLQGGRHSFIFASYFFLRKLKREDIDWIIKALLYITLIHGCLYIIQCFTHLPVLFVNAQDTQNAHSGNFRYYNYPILATFYLLHAILHPTIMGRKQAQFAGAVLIITIILTQGRTFIVCNALICLIGLLLRGKLTRIAQWSIIGGFLLLPFLDNIVARFTHDNTESDIEQILSGDFIENAQSGNLNEGTLTYRFAWVAERYFYLEKRPLGEQLFGLGMISDSQKDVVNKKYDFSIGLSDKEHGVYQLYTPDSAWGNFLTRFGALGTTLTLLLLFNLFAYLHKLRRLHPYLMCESLFLLFLLFNSIAESHLTDLGNLVFPLLICTFALNVYIEKESLEEEQQEEGNEELDYLETNPSI